MIWLQPALSHIFWTMLLGPCTYNVSTHASWPVSKQAGSVSLSHFSNIGEQ